MFNNSLTFGCLFMSFSVGSFDPSKLEPRFSGTFVCRELRQGWSSLKNALAPSKGCQKVPKGICGLFSLVSSEISSVLCMCNYNCSSRLVSDIMFKAPAWTGNSITSIHECFLYVFLNPLGLCISIGWSTDLPCYLWFLIWLNSLSLEDLDGLTESREWGTACWHQELSTYIKSHTEAWFLPPWLDSYLLGFDHLQDMNPAQTFHALQARLWYHPGRRQGPGDCFLLLIFQGSLRWDSQNKKLWEKGQICLTRMLVNSCNLQLVVVLFFVVNLTATSLVFIMLWPCRKNVPSVCTSVLWRVASPNHPQKKKGL